MADSVTIVWTLDIITLILFIFIAIVIFFSSNFQGWYAGRQILRGRSHLLRYKKHAFEVIHSLIDPICPATITRQDVDSFIDQMLNFFLIPPAVLDPPYFNKLHDLIIRREKRYRELIRQFLPTIDDIRMARLTAVMQATTEIENSFKKVQHNYILGRKTKSTWFLLQSAAELTQTLLSAKAYYGALWSFIGDKPIGDSIGPLSVTSLIEETNRGSQKDDHSIIKLTEVMIGQKISFEQRECICIRAKGPAPVVGNPGEALSQYLKNIPEQKKTIKLIITIDAIMKLEGEDSGTVAQGLGVAIGGGSTEHIDQYRVESIAVSQTPPIPTETIVCRESLEESILPMTDVVYTGIPKIIRIIKQIIRSQTQPNDLVLIMGIGNALGVP